MMSDDEVKELLESTKTIAVVGLSSDPSRPSFGVAEYLQSRGYRIIPVNPNETAVLGEKAYARLTDVPDQVDIADIFRRPDGVPAVVEDAVAKGVRCVWMQEGIEHPDAAQRAEQAGIHVMMDHCLLKEHRRLRPKPRS